MNDLSNKLSLLAERLKKSGTDAIQKGKETLSGVVAFPQGKKKTQVGIGAPEAENLAPQLQKVVEEISDDEIEKIIDQKCQETSILVDKKKLLDRVKQTLAEAMVAVGDLPSVVRRQVLELAGKQESDDAHTTSFESHGETEHLTEIQRMTYEQLELQINEWLPRYNQLVEETGKETEKKLADLNSKLTAKLNKISTSESIQNTVQDYFSDYQDAKQKNNDQVKQEAVEKASERWWNSGFIGGLLCKIPPVKDASDALKKSTQEFFEAKFAYEEMEDKLNNGNVQEIVEDFRRYDDCFGKTLDKFSFEILAGKQNDRKELEVKIHPYQQAQEDRKRAARDAEALRNAQTQTKVQRQQDDLKQTWGDLVDDTLSEKKVTEPTTTI